MALTDQRGMPTRTDTIRRYVQAWCPRCHEESGGSVTRAARLPGYLSEADGRVWLVRGCEVHGRVVTLYDESPEILTWLEQWTAPTKVHVPDTPGNFTPAPSGYLAGLGELQTQHTCILVTDITEHCNLSCPTCFTASGPELGAFAPTADVLANLDARLARENGQLDVVMLSGGEPTLHPDFAGLLEGVLARNVVRLMVNTNGLTVARDDALLALLARHRDRVEVYLQFDGFELETHKHHRGADLRRIKEQAIARLASAGIFTTLTMTTALGVNDHEIGAVVDLALATPYVVGVSLQPQFGAGRSGEIDAVDRLTHTGVLARLGPQTGGRVTWRDLTALPCSHPHCCSVGYLFRMDEQAAPGTDPVWRSLVDILGADALMEHLGLLANRGMADKELADDLRLILKESLLGLLSEKSSLTNPATQDLFAKVCESCDLGIPALMKLARTGASRRKLRELLAQRVVRVTVKPFMDIDTMIDERLLQCCVHVGTRSETQDQCAPFCAVQTWTELADQRMSHAAGAFGAAPRRSLPMVVATTGASA